MWSTDNFKGDEVMKSAANWYKRYLAWFWKHKIISAIIILIIIVAAVTSSSSKENTSDTTAVTTTPTTKTVQSQAKEVSIADKVNKALDNLGDGMKTTLASTGPGGLQGDIVGVKADGKDGVIVKVSTNYSDSGDGEDGGQGIARRIFTNICFDVPELKTMYVTSTTSGLDSRSVYRSETPACNQ